MKRIKCNKGAALAEAAVLLPVLIFLMVAVVQIGMFVNTKLVIGEAAREAAREYATYGEEEGEERAKERVGSIMSSLTYSGGFDINDPYYYNLISDGEQVTVSVGYDSPVILPGFGNLISDSPGLSAPTYHFSGTVTLMIEDFEGILSNKD